MNGRQRIRLALNHQQPDRVPFDLGATNVTGIHMLALRRLRRHLGLNDDFPPPIHNILEQTGWVEEDLLSRLNVDAEGVFPAAPSTFKLQLQERADDWYYLDEWQVGRRMPKDHGLYFDLVDAPLKDAHSLSDIDAFAWPDGGDKDRFIGIAERARQITQEHHRACVATGVTAGVMETASWLRGYESFFTDLVENRDRIESIFEHIVQIKMAYWERALPILGENVEVVVEADDLGGQNSLLISPRMYRSLLKPYHKWLFDFIHARTRAKLFLHSCGAIRPLIPDLIEVGVDILNPVQVSAAGMDTAELKKEFGSQLSFWGGGVDTQRILGQGTPDDVRAEVRRRISDLAPDGGFVFATVHCVQANVPPENLVAMQETLQEAGVYES
jgi:uroporphyrinogen decarboxylase